MKFVVRQRITGSVEQVERAMLDERYLPFLLEHHGVLLEAQLLERSEDGGLGKRKVRYRPKPGIKSVGPRSVPPEWFAFVETSTYDRKSHTLTFSNVPTPKRIQSMRVNTGALALRDAGGGETERMVEGDVSLKLPFFLKPVAMLGERLIKAEGIKLLEAEAPVLSRFIAEVLG